MLKSKETRISIDEIEVPTRPREEHKEVEEVVDSEDDGEEVPPPVDP